MLDHNVSPNGVEPLPNNTNDVPALFVVLSAIVNAVLPNNVGFVKLIVYAIFDFSVFV
jgi:hypothetical protein